VAKGKTPTQKAVRAARALETVPHPGLRFSYKHHVFIAKLKRGEVWALNHLSIPARARVTPLFEMWPKANKTLEAHTNSLLQTVRDEWHPLPFYLDTRYVPAGGVPSPNSAATIFNIARARGLLAVPATSLPFAPAYQQQIANIIAQDHRGVMVRLFVTDFINPSLLGNYLTALLGVLGINHAQTDVMIDLGFRQTQVDVEQLGGSTLSVLPFRNNWRTVTLAAGCFPASITNVAHGIWHPLPRVDWLGWQAICASQTLTNGRLPTYADYAIRCGGPPLEIPNTPDPNIRYSTPNDVLVRRESKHNGRMKMICQSLIQRADFSGAAFSQGDARIAATAAIPGSPNNGQAEQWIQWCTNHHLELTASQIQSLP
jgi:hypothetical protein